MTIDDSENAHYNYVGVVEDEEQKGAPAKEYYAPIEAADDAIEAAEEFLENLQADHTMPTVLHPSVEELRHIARVNIEAIHEENLEKVKYLGRINIVFVKYKP